MLNQQLLILKLKQYLLIEWWADMLVDFGSVSAGMYLAPDDTTAGEFEATASSGTTASNIIALTAKDSDDKVVAGFI